MMRTRLLVGLLILVVLVGCAQQPMVQEGPEQPTEPPVPSEPASIVEDVETGEQEPPAEEEEKHHVPTEPVGVLEEVEINEYQGEKLDSVDDFRENSIKGPQYVDVDKYSLKVTGLVGEEKEYSYEDILNNYDSYSKVVTLNCVEGWSVRILWEGMLVRELLDEAGPLAEANTVIFHAYDGYSSAYPLEYFYDDDIMLAYRQNNATLMPERGFPFQLVAESKWGYKWVKWVTEIELSDDRDYRGYWESRGYAKEGNLDESFLG